MTWLLNIAYLAAAVLYFPVLVYQWTIQKKNRRGWRQRFGGINLPPANGTRVWIHAVSLGEINCTPRLVKELQAARPDLDVVISTTTDTGYARACQLYPRERVFRFPLDLSWMVRRALNRIRPSLIVLVELEVWPNLATLAKQRAIPVAVINGRLTERSGRRLAWVAPVTRRMFGGLNWVGAQDETIARRFEQVGVPRDLIKITGSMKWDTADIVEVVPGAEALAGALGLDAARPLWVCGSTGPGEEELILDAYREEIGSNGAAVTLAIVPRKPERFEDVARTIRGRGLGVLRRSERPDGVPPPEYSGSLPVILGDTMGELRKFYSLATVVFVGRSLVPLGGSDPMEVAALGKPVIAGPHMDNFWLPVNCLRAAGALVIVQTPGELAAAVDAAVRNPKRTGELSRIARQVVLENQGATLRTVCELARLLELRVSGSPSK